MPWSAAHQPEADVSPIIADAQAHRAARERQESTERFWGKVANACLPVFEIPLTIYALATGELL